MSRRRNCWSLSLLAALVATASAAAQEPPFDLIIRNGRIVDGTGNPWFRGDLAIRGDRIAAVGRIAADAPTRGGRSTPRGWSLRPGSSTPTRIPTGSCSRTATPRARSARA